MQEERKKADILTIPMVVNETLLGLSTNCVRYLKIGYISAFLRISTIIRC